AKARTAFQREEESSAALLLPPLSESFRKWSGRFRRGEVLSQQTRKPQSVKNRMSGTENNVGAQLRTVACEFFVPADAKSAILEAVKAAFPDEMFFDSEIDAYCLMSDATTLADVLSALGWYYTEDADGNIVRIGGEGG